MTSELQAMFAHAEAQFEAAAAGESMDEVSRARVRNHIKRAGTWRNVRMAGVAAAAAGALGVSAWFGTSSLRDEDPAMPLPSPTASVSQAAPSPSPSPSPTQTLSEAETPDPELAQLVASLDPDLYPEAQPVTQAMWDQVGEGWALATYQPNGWRLESGTMNKGPQVLLIASPAGGLFVVAELPEEQLIRVTSWDLDTGLATAQVRSGDSSVADWRPATLDVSTGEYVLTGGTPEAAGYTGTGIARFTQTFVDATGAWECVPIDDAAEGGFVTCADAVPVYAYCGDTAPADRPDIVCRPLDYIDPTLEERNPFIGTIASADSDVVTALYPIVADVPLPVVLGVRTGDETTTVAMGAWAERPWFHWDGDVLVRVTATAIEVVAEDPAGRLPMRAVFPSVGGTWVARTADYNEQRPYDLAFVSDSGEVTTVIRSPAVRTDLEDPIMESLISVTVAQ